MPDTPAITIRRATPADVPALSRLLQALVAARKRTARTDEAFVLSHYVANPDGISCFVAEESGGALLGLQSMKRTAEGNSYGTPAGWGFIGTHVSPNAARRGVGSGLFRATLEAAQAAGVPAIEAYIGAGNSEGQAYYEALGFRTWRAPEGSVCKRFDLPA
ncbi:GNAT family N-acetyltransferase [Alloyangia pacifica]|uniref:L-amino acid N-acyltransferase YncA n=1 Tax=Alloyangia pacifica TaxID=311180 RepID=A0A1I6PF68_9RHOB|nr:GNAT family N-acetyltransferase [Alloyangia pacifica]SDG26329.1 L-amino acid N-acyltransferase YncA [Alloyangia pacifica]SFS38851.1 L-amino acid N-acyltransferase YncA [Alloyangia pacifica]